MLFGKAPVLDNNSKLQKITLTKIVNLIKTDKKLKEATTEVRKSKDKTERNKLKRTTLDYIIPFNYSKLIRSQENFESAEYMIFESDGVEDPHKEITRIKKDPRIVMAYTSVSNNGFKFMIKLNQKIESQYYYRSYMYFQQMFNDQFGIELDPANNDMARVQFLCHDPKVYYNVKAKAVDVKEIIYQLQILDDSNESSYIPELIYDVDEIPKAIAHMHKKGYHEMQDESLWWKLSMALASLGEDGREYFLQLSCDHPLYPKDTEKTMNKKFDYLIEQYGRYHNEDRLLTINSFFSIAKNKFDYKIKKTSKRAIELLLANEFYNEYEDTLIYDHSRLSAGKLYSWFIWDGRVYTSADKGQVANLYVKFLEKKKHEIIKNNKGKDEEEIKEREKELSSYGELTLSNISRAESRRFRDLTLDWASTKPKFAIKPDELDTDLDLFNTQSGIIDLKTNKVMPHDQRYRMTKLSPVNHVKKSKCHNWEQFIDKIFFGNSNIINYVQEAIGYSLTGYTTEQCLFFLYGTGANGKSTFLEAIKHIMGEYSLHANYETFTNINRDGSGHSEDIVRLRGSRMVSTTEINTNKPINESLIKSMTGGDMITARALHASSIEFTPHFKLWIAGNHKPKLTNFDIGIRRRFHIIPFNYRFRSDEIRPQTEVLNEFKEEASGILNWMLEGAQRWYKRGRLVLPVEVEEETQKYFKESNFIEQFLDDVCDISPTVSSSALNMYQKYYEYSNENHEQPLGRNKFYGRLEELGFTRQRDSSLGKQVINGIELKTDIKKESNKNHKEAI